MLINLRCGFRSLNCTKRFREERVWEWEQKSQPASRRSSDYARPPLLPHFPIILEVSHKGPIGEPIAVRIISIIKIQAHTHTHILRARMMRAKPAEDFGISDCWTGVAGNVDNIILWAHFYCGKVSWHWLWGTTWPSSSLEASSHPG